MVSSVHRFLKDPLHVDRRILVNSLLPELFFPRDHVSVLDAVFRKTRGLSNGTHGESGLRRKRAQTALEAPCLERDDNSGLALEALGAAIDKSSLRGRVGETLIIELNEGVDHGVEPSTGLYVV
jgi:hypothetical protein